MKYFVGIDIGSTASKCVMLADGTEIVAKALIPVGAGTSGPQRAIDEVLKAAGKTREEMSFVLATGYGRKEFIPALNAAPELPQTYVLTGGLPDTAAMPVRWGTARIEARSIQRLTKNEQEEYVYVDEAAITAATTDAGIRLEAADGVTPSSGSYRMTLHWMWNGISLRKQTVYFFINTQ